MSCFGEEPWAGGDRDCLRQLHRYNSLRCGKAPCESERTERISEKNSGQRALGQRSQLSWKPTASQSGDFRCASTGPAKCHPARGEVGVDRVVTFSGCPGDSETSKFPNWVTSAWPEDYPKILEWQWKEKVIPFWQAEAEFAEKNGIDMLCIEMHPSSWCTTRRRC